MVKKAIKFFLVAEAIVLITLLYSFELFINAQIAFLSAMFVILGTLFAYKKMVEHQVKMKPYDEKRSLLDSIEDPYELYEDTIEGEESSDLQAVVKEERAKIKTLSLSSMKHGIRGSFSLFRIMPYLFLVFAFIALSNNNLLNVAFYLPFLMFGVVMGSVISRELVS